MRSGERSAGGRAARRASQRQRLLDSFTELAGSEGFTATSIARVIAGAGVSRPTFYEYFTDKEACLVAAAEQAGERLLAEVRDEVASEPPERAHRAAIRAMADFAAERPEGSRVLMAESTAAATETATVKPTVSRISG